MDGIGTASPPTTAGAVRGGPVARRQAGAHLMVMAASFGVAVVLTRLYLAVTGYPQIGGGTYHVAHALWGGLLLTVASMLPLVWANRWALTLAALLAGAGVGLFIDEVGKFITQANDYFFPLAAPIIYLAFLLVLYLARRATRPRTYDARGQTYLVLDGLTDLADARLLPSGRADLVRRLTAIEGSTGRPDLVQLAGHLGPFVTAASVTSAPGAWARRRAAVVAGLERWERRLLPRRVHRLVLVAGALVVGLFSAFGLLVLVVLLDGGSEGELVLDDRRIEAGSGDPTLVLAAAGEGVVGVMLLASALMLLLRRDAPGVRIGRWALVLVLAVVNVFLGYLDAELVVTAVLIELALLWLYLRYAARFLRDGAT